METTQLRYGRFVLLLVVVAFVSGALVEAVRTVPDPGLFTPSTGTIITIAVTAGVLAVIVLRPPSWLTHTRRPGTATD
ncbi:MAG: hypothetical protein M3515_08335 [Actinomycetota bacterium]|nr:hypothetical protein [Actinomycetota bacterium]